MFWSNNGILSIESEREVEGCGEGAVVPPFFSLATLFCQTKHFGKKEEKKNPAVYY